MLAQDMCGKAVGVDVRAALGVGQNIDLAMCLLERLADLVPVEPVAPGGDVVDRMADGMPEFDGGAFAQSALRLVIDIDELAVEPDSIGGGAVGLEVPDEAAGDHADERMVEIAGSPGAEGPALPRQEQAVDAFALSGQHLADVLDRGLKFLDVVGVLFLDGGRKRFEWLAVCGPGPAQLGVLPVGDELSDVVTEDLAPATDFLHAVARHGELVDFVARQAFALGRSRQGLFELFLRGDEFDFYLQECELTDRVHARHCAERGDRRVAERNQSWSFAGQLAIRALGDCGQSTGQVAVGDEAGVPAQPSEDFDVMLFDHVVVRRLPPRLLLRPGAGARAINEWEPAKNPLLELGVPERFEQLPGFLEPFGRRLARAGRLTRCEDDGPVIAPRDIH